MEEIILKMVEQAKADGNYDLIDYARRLVDELAETINCPSNWRDIGEKLARKYQDDSWVYDQMQLYYYE